jgi:hypothetical protein
MAKLGGAPTVVVAAVTVGCGLLLIGGVGPSTAAELDGERPPEAAASDVALGIPAESSVPDSSTAPSTTPPSTTPPSTTPPSTEVTNPPEVASPVPLSVTPSSVTVGPGGTARLSGTCPLVDGVALGPVEIWEVGESISVLNTGVTAADWSYDWTAPAEPAEIVLQVWCGDPSNYEGGYPQNMQIDVVFVAQVPAPTTIAAADPGAEIPSTD